MRLCREGDAAARTIFHFGEVILVLDALELRELCCCCFREV